MNWLQEFLEKNKKQMHGVCAIPDGNSRGSNIISGRWEDTSSSNEAVKGSFDFETHYELFIIYI